MADDWAVEDVALIVVAYAVLDEEEEWIRIISARKVTRQERMEYEEANEIQDSHG
jgi:uncharacterized DUF497 family protein